MTISRSIHVAASSIISINSIVLTPVITARVLVLWAFESETRISPHCGPLGAVVSPAFRASFFLGASPWLPPVWGGHWITGWVSVNSVSFLSLLQSKLWEGAAPRSRDSPKVRPRCARPGPEDVFSPQPPPRAARQGTPPSAARRDARRWSGRSTAAAKPDSTWAAPPPTASARVGAGSIGGRGRGGRGERGSYLQPSRGVRPRSGVGASGRVASWTWSQKPRTLLLR